MLVKTGVTVFTGQTLNTSTDVFCRNGKAEMAGWLLRCPLARGSNSRRRVKMLFSSVLVLEPFSWSVLAFVGLGFADRLQIATVSTLAG